MVTRIWRKAVNAFWEMRLGISTGGLHFPDLSGDENIHYGTQSYAETFRVLEALQFRPEDVLVDLGCGKGRVICLASRFALGRVIGVDLSSELCHIARKNAQSVRGKATDILVQNINAVDFDFSVGTIFYMFHPFGPQTMKKVLQKMADGLRRNPRTIRVVYSNPIHEDLLSGVTWLERYSYWTKDSHPFVSQSVAFWRSQEERYGETNAVQDAPTSGP